jgi:hypothetical protein
VEIRNTRALDKEGQTTSVYSSRQRAILLWQPTFKIVMRADHRRLPFSIAVDKHASYPGAFTGSQQEKVLPADCRLRRTKYRTNIARVGPSIHPQGGGERVPCFRSFHTAERTLVAAFREVLWKVAHIKTEQGILQVHFFPEPMAAEKIEVTERREGERYIYSFVGQPEPQTNDTINSRWQEYFTKHRNLFIVTSEKELDAAVKRAFASS